MTMVTSLAAWRRLSTWGGEGCVKLGGHGKGWAASSISYFSDNTAHQVEDTVDYLDDDKDTANNEDTIDY